MWSCRSSLNSRPRSCEPVAITRETSSVPWSMVWHGHPSQNGNPCGYEDKSKLMDWWPSLNLAKNSQCLDSGTSVTQTRECLDLVEMSWSKVYVAIPHWRCWNLLKAIIYRRKFRSQTSDNMDRRKAEQGRGREKRKIRRKKIRRERVRRKKMQMCEKVGKSRNTVFFQWFGAPEGRKVGSLKRRVRSQLATGAMKNCTPLWREAHFQVKMYKTPGVRTTFGTWDVEKVHAVVARSTFPSQNVQNTSASDHFWELRCRKSARRCGAKHISKSKCTKHTMVGPLLEVAMSKKCTPLWCEAHFQVKSVKNWRSRTTFGGSDVEKVSKKCTPLWREAHFEVKSVKNWGFWAFFDVKMSKK